MLRMVMLYKKLQCPLCNGDLDQVSISAPMIVSAVQTVLDKILTAAQTKQQVNAHFCSLRLCVQVAIKSVA